jgi:hypothetical protein
MVVWGSLSFLTIFTCDITNKTDHHDNIVESGIKYHNLNPIYDIYYFDLKFMKYFLSDSNLI